MNAILEGPKARYPGEFFLALSRRPLEFLDQLRNYPDLCGFSNGPVRVAVLRRPDLVEQVLTGHYSHFAKGRALARTSTLLGQGLLTSEGEQHLCHRRMVAPAFSKGRVCGYAETMVEETLDFRDRLGRQAAAQPASLDLHRAMMELTLKIAARTLFGSRVDRRVTQVGQSLDAVLESFGYLLLPFFEFLSKTPLPPMIRFRRARRALDEVVYEIIDSKPPSDCLLGRLIEGGELTREQLRDEVMTLLLAGHETTANALTFSFYLLGAHPQSRRRMLDEIDRELQGRIPTPADVGRLSYTGRVLSEALRLYPPSWAVGRRALQPLELDGHPIAAETVLLMPQWLLHRDQRYFDRPGEFDPDRWLEPSHPRYAYFPFGGGSRICIGERFARSEAILVLATLSQQFCFELEQTGPPALKAGITLRPQGGLPVTVVPRDDCSSRRAL